MKGIDYRSYHYRNIMSDLHHMVNRVANRTQAARFGKVTAITNGNYYDVTLPDDRVMEAVANNTPIKYAVNDWVCMEQVSGDWYIVGASPDCANGDSVNV